MVCAHELFEQNVWTSVPLATLPSTRFMCETSKGLPRLAAQSLICAAVLILYPWAGSVLKGAPLLSTNVVITLQLPEMQERVERASPVGHTTPSAHWKLLIAAPQTPAVCRKGCESVCGYVCAE